MTEQQNPPADGLHDLGDVAEEFGVDLNDETAPEAHEDASSVPDDGMVVPEDEAALLDDETASQPWPYDGTGRQDTHP